MSLPFILHLLAAIIWVGGMFFAYLCLRPATNALDAPVRLQLWASVLRQFFRWIWPAIIVLFVSGFWMFLNGVRGMHVQLMMALGIVMMLLAAHVYFAPYKRLKRMVAVRNWQEAARQLRQIRSFIAVNLGFGLIVVTIAASGRYGFHA